MNDATHYHVHHSRERDHKIYFKQIPPRIKKVGKNEVRLREQWFRWDGEEWRTATPDLLGMERIV